MDKVLSTLATMPDFLRDMFAEHMVLCVAGILLFLLALMIPGRFGSLLRKIVILANIMFAMAGGFMGKSQNGYQIICLSAVSLLILSIVRLIVRITGAIRQRRIDARIEEKALAKAAKRRGSFKKRQGYSGESREIDDEDFVPPSSSHAEIRKVIENEINEGKAREEATLAAYGAEASDDDLAVDYDVAIDKLSSSYHDTYDSDYDIDDDQDEIDRELDRAAGFGNADEEEGPTYIPLQQDDEPLPVPEDLPDGVFYVRPRPLTGQARQKAVENDVYEALKRLAELRDNGILTDGEFEDKKAELLARIHPNK